jgi:hypothetical protein
MAQQGRWGLGGLSLILTARTTLAALATECVTEANGALVDYPGGGPCGIVTPTSVSLPLLIKPWVHDYYEACLTERLGLHLMLQSRLRLCGRWHLLLF